MKNNYLLIGVILGFLAVMLGAFGAHSLKEMVSSEALQSFETGVRYQMYHAIVILVVNGNSFFDPKAKRLLSLLFVLGIFLFSGSIYAITLGLSAKLIWFVTPLGGLILLLGWLVMGYKVLKSKKAQNKVG